MYQNNNQKSSFNGILIFIGLMLIGIFLGRMINEEYQKTVKREVKEALDRVIMIEVPQIDREVGKYLSENKYDFKYITAIDLSDGMYGIYEIKKNEVKAYAHGKCTSIGEAQPGIYKIVEKKDYLDYHDARYWTVVYLERDEDGEELIVSSSPYEIDNKPIFRLNGDNTDDLGNIMIDGEVIKTVYDNSIEGIVLIIIDSGKHNSKSIDLDLEVNNNDN